MPITHFSEPNEIKPRVRNKNKVQKKTVLQIWSQIKNKNFLIGGKSGSS